MQLVSIMDARNNFSALVSAAEKGADVLITRRGLPVVRVVVVAEPRLTAGQLAARLERIPSPGFRRTAQQVDDDLRVIRDGWSY